MTNVFDYHRRLPANFITDKVEDFLPEYFSAEYPNLVTFLKKYYEYAERDDEGFSYIIQTLYQARDLSSNTLQQLDNVFYEIGNGTQSSDFFSNSRNVAKLFSTFHKLKGTKLSAQSFFRAFYGEEIEVVYPKNNMFIINDSKIGSESLKFIQNDERYQIHSILIRSGIPLANWQVLYKSLVHPGGFYLAGDTIIEQSVSFAVSLPTILPDSDAGRLVYESIVTFAESPFTSITQILADDVDSDSFAERVSVERNRLSVFSGFTLGGFDNQYNSFIDAIDPNAPTFDQDSDGIIRAVDFSNSVETMDQSIYDYWDSANNTFQYQDSV